MSIYKKWQVGRLQVAFRYRTKDEWMGRFGGGWNWKLGIALGGNTVLLSLLICEISLSWRKPFVPQAGKDYTS